MLCPIVIFLHKMKVNGEFTSILKLFLCGLIWMKANHGVEGNDSLSSISRVDKLEINAQMQKGPLFIYAKDPSRNHPASNFSRELIATTAGTSFLSVKQTYLNFTYCSSKPKFKIGSGSLLTYLLRLKLCQLAEGKAWFAEECKVMTYNFTKYYSAVYIKFCHPMTFYDQCKFISSKKQETFYDDASFAARQWLHRNGLYEILDVNLTATSQQQRQLNFDTSYCKNINSFFNSLPVNSTFPLANPSYLFQNSSRNAMANFDSPFSDVQYAEWFLTFRPFCQPVACGVSRNFYHNASITAYDCFTEKCRPAIKFVMVLDLILALVIVVANVLVLSVAIRTKIMRNVPGYFKISLAIADLLVGLFVLPGSVYQNYVFSLEPLPYRTEGQAPLATDYFDQRYLDFMGIFTILSFSVSVHTMGAASIDRFLAVTKPFRYRQGKYLTKTRSIVVFVFIWLFGFFCAIYPVFTSNSYTISALSLTLSTGFASIMVYVLTLGLPLLAVWCINALMLRKVRQDGKKRRRISSDSKRSNGSIQSKKGGVTRTSSHETSHKNVANRIPSIDPIIDNEDALESREDRNKTNNNHNLSSISMCSPTLKSLGSSGGIASVSSRIKRHLNRLNSGSLVRRETVERRLAKTLAVMIGAFTLALLPCIILLAIQPAILLWISPRTFPKTYSPIATNIYTSAEYIASRLFLSNSFWNCVIYSIRNQRFRCAIADVFLCSEEQLRKRRRSNSATASSVSSRGIIGNHSKRLSKMPSNDSGC